MRPRERLLPGACVAILMATLALVASPASSQQDISVSVTLELLPGTQVTAPSGQDCFAGDTVYYLFTLQNTGDLTTAYRLGLRGSPKWRAALPDHPDTRAGPLLPGAVEIIPVAVTVPAGAPAGSTGGTTLSATATTKPRPSDADTVITTVIPDPTIPEVVTAPPGQSGPPGTAITYAFELRNTGVTDATFRLRLSSSPRWSTALPGHPSGKAGPLAPGALETVPVVVEIPADAGIGATCNTTLKAVRQGRPKIEGEDTVTTTVAAPAALRLTLSQEAETGAYTASLTNVSDAVQRVRVTGSTARGVVAFPGARPEAEVRVEPGATSVVPLSIARETGSRGRNRGYVIVQAEALDSPFLRLYAAAWTW